MRTLFDPPSSHEPTPPAAPAPPTIRPDGRRAMRCLRRSSAVRLRGCLFHDADGRLGEIFILIGGFRVGHRGRALAQTATLGVSSTIAFALRCPLADYGVAAVLSFDSGSRAH